MHLARYLGLTLEEVNSLPAEEMIKWTEYFKLYPPGLDDDVRFAKLMSLIYQMISGKPLEVETIFPTIKASQEAQRERNALLNKQSGIQRFLASVAPYLVGGKPLSSFTK